jgi:hypothetical protein
MGRVVNLAGIGFTGLASFQAALAAGAPWGHAAWGGSSAHLTTAQDEQSVATAGERGSW